MFKLARMPYPAMYYCSNGVQNTMRSYVKKGDRIIQLKIEEKKIFGPLLETTKEKASRKKLMNKITSSSGLNLNDTKNEKIEEDGERFWALEVANPACIHVFKKKPEARETNEFSDRSSKVMSIQKDTITTMDKVDVVKNEINDMVDIITPIRNASIIHTEKSDVDKWESPTILSLSPINQQHYSLPGVTRILNESMSDEAKLLLENWKKRMILKLGEAGFETYQRELLQDSKIMHSLIESTLKKEPIDIPNHLQLTYKSISDILKDIKDVRFIESHVVHPTLGYRGFIDCVATYKGNVCVIDWKKTDKLKTLNTIYDSPLQVSAYIGALNSDENYSFKVKMGLLAFAYAQGQPPSVFELSGARLELYWKEWLKRLEKYYTMRFSSAL